MGNKFDMISANPSGSINNLNLLNETFHVFSKSPASDVTTLGGARLKSGHTTTASDVWADEIPAFFSAANQAKFDLFSTLAVKDDLCIFGGKVYQHNGTQFVSLGTEAEVLVDGATFQKNNKDVIKYHKNRTAINLTADNNNGDGSNNLSAKIYDAATGSTNFVSQFISSTDKMVAGVPSLAYDATVIAGGVKLAEGLTNDNDYICNAYAGVIQFNKARSSGVTVSAWEYIGDKLTTSISGLRQSIKDISDVTLKGVVASVTADEQTAQKAGITVDNTVSTTPVIKFTGGSVTAGETKLVTGGTVASAISTAISNSIADGGAIDNRIDSVIDSELSATTTAGTIGYAIANAQQAAGDAYVVAKAKVSSVAGPTTGLVTVSTNASTNAVTVNVSEKLASTDDITLTGITLNNAAVTPTNKVANITAVEGVTTTAVNGVALAKDGNNVKAAVTAAGYTAATGDNTVGTWTNKDNVVTGTVVDTRVADAIKEAKAYSNSLHTTSVTYHVSETLPTVPSGKEEEYKGRIYLVTTGKDGVVAADGSRIEYMYVNEGTEDAPSWDWEQIGTTTADLSGYAKGIKYGMGGTYSVGSDGYINVGTIIKGAGVVNRDDPQNHGNNINILQGNTFGVSKDGTSLLVSSATENIFGLVKLTKTIDTSDEAAAKATTSTAVKSYADTKVGDVQWFGENDLLSTKAEVVDGKLVVTEQEIINPNGTNPWNANVTKVVNNEAFIGDTKYATIETNKIKDGSEMFYHTSLSEFDSDLDSLTAGDWMFANSDIESFTCDLSSLTNGNGMFSNNPNNINTFIGDLSSLTNGMSMFINDYQLTTFISDLSSLTAGRDMFNRTNLSLESVECIADTINTFAAQIDIVWQTLPAESERQALVDELSRIVDRGWTLGTNQELLPLFDSEKYETGLSTVQPLDLDSEPQTIYYVVKK